jgi:[NiFe] hydrogenase assembly HybE family chaperone
MQWQNGGQIRLALETVFNDILETRLRGVPVINPALSVQAVGFNPFNEDWLGVLITPWFMNLLLLPGQDSHWREQPSGSKFEQPFPYGTFEFTLAHEAQLGTYALCSLFSPMFQFDNQSAALGAAQSALQGLLTAPAARVVSRRNLLRGSFGSRE